VSQPERPESLASELLSHQPQITHKALSQFGQDDTGIYWTNIQIYNILFYYNKIQSSWNTNKPF